MPFQLSVLKLALAFSCLSTKAFTHDTVILVCDWNPAKISRVSLTTSKIEKLAITNIARPVAVDYDEEWSTIYWTDVVLRQIRATKATDATDRIVISLANDSVPDGLALDTGLQKVFYTDAGRNMIGVVDMDGRNHEDLITSGLDHPWAIVLDQETRKFYFTQWGASSYVAVANYDGSNFLKIYTTDLIAPTGLALDKTSNMLFWCDDKTNKIETGSVTGIGRKVLMHDPTALFFDIFLFESILYYTDWNRPGVMSMPKAGGQVGILTSGQITKLAGLHVYSTARKCGSWPPCPGCGQCLANTACEERLGICLAGCKPGYKGQSCKNKCPRGSYGLKCDRFCRPCEHGRCDHVTGFCPIASGGIRPVFREHLQSLVAVFFFSYVCVQTALID